MGIPKMEREGDESFMVQTARQAAGMPAVALVRDVTDPEASFEDSGLLRADMTDAERIAKLSRALSDARHERDGAEAEVERLTTLHREAESRADTNAQHCFDMLDRERALRAELAAVTRERDALDADRHAAIQEVASFWFETFGATTGREILTTIHAVEAFGHTPAIRWLKDNGACVGITIAARVAA